MGTSNIRRILRAAKEFDFIGNAEDIIRRNEDFLVSLLKTQLAAGKDSNDEPVKIFGRDYYSDRTIFDKEHGNYPPLGKVTEWITNYRTGAFYDSIRLVAVGKNYTFTSDIDYYGEILARSGPVIMKLNKENALLFTEEVLKPELQRRFNAFK